MGAALKSLSKSMHKARRSEWEEEEVRRPGGMVVVSGGVEAKVPPASAGHRSDRGQSSERHRSVVALVLSR